MIKDKPQAMEKRNLICLFCNQQKFNQSTLDSNISMLMMEEEEGSVMEATKIGGKRSLLNRAAKSSKSLLTSLTTMQMGTKTVMKRRMVMGTRALEEGRRNRRLVCLCLPMVMKSSLVLGMVAGGAMVEQVDSNSLLIRGDLILAVNGTMLAGKQMDEVEDLIIWQSDINIKQTQLLNIILWRSGGV